MRLSLLAATFWGLCLTPGLGLQIQCYQCEEFQLNNDCSAPEFIVNCTVNVQDMCQKEVMEKSFGKSCLSIKPDLKHLRQNETRNGSRSERNKARRMRHSEPRVSQSQNSVTWTSTTSSESPTNLEAKMKENQLVSSRNHVSQILRLFGSVSDSLCGVPVLLFPREGELCLYQLLQHATLQWTPAEEEGEFWRGAAGTRADHPSAP